MKVNDLSLEQMLSIIDRDQDIVKHTLVIYSHVQVNKVKNNDHYETMDPETGIHGIVEANAADLRDLNKLKEEYIGNSKKYLLGISSKVELKDEVPGHMHMFFLDFRCPAFNKSIEGIKNLVNGLGITPGFIVKSGRSYHYYSNRVLIPSAWRSLLEEAEGSDIVDGNWVALQLRRGYSVLRLTTNKDKTNPPEVIEAVGYTAENPRQLYLFGETPRVLRKPTN